MARVGIAAATAPEAAVIRSAVAQRSGTAAGDAFTSAVVGHVALAKRDGPPWKIFLIAERAKLLLLAADHQLLIRTEHFVSVQRALSMQLLRHARFIAHARNLQARLAVARRLARRVAPVNAQTAHHGT